MKLSYVILYVQNVGRAVDFYERAFGLPRRFIHESQQYAELETGATTLALVAAELAGAQLPGGITANDPSLPPAGIEVAFTTADVPAAYERAVKAGARAIAAPQAKPWGQTVAYVRDLDGVLVELCTPMS